VLACVPACLPMCVCLYVCLGVCVCKICAAGCFKATFGKCFRDRMERIIMGFSEHTDNHPELNCRLKVWQVILFKSYSWLSFNVWIIVHRNYLHSTCSQVDIEKQWAVKYTVQIVSVPSCAACWYPFLLFDFSTGWIHWRLCTNSWKVSSPSFSSSPLVHLPVNPESLMLTRIWCWQEGRYRISCFWC